MKSISSIRQGRSFQKPNMITSAGLWDWLFTLNKNKNENKRGLYIKSDPNFNSNIVLRQRKLINVYKNNSIQKSINRDISKKNLTIKNTPSRANKSSKLLSAQTNSRDQEIKLNENYKELISSFNEILKNDEYLKDPKMMNSDILLQALNKRWGVMEIPQCHREYILEYISKSNSKTSNKISRELLKLLIQNYPIRKLTYWEKNRQTNFNDLMIYLEKIDKKGFKISKKYLKKVIEKLEELRNSTYKFGFWLQEWRKELKKLLNINTENYLFYKINFRNYIEVFQEEYLRLYNSNLQFLVNISKKFDPLFLMNSIIRGNKSLIDDSKQIQSRGDNEDTLAIPIEERQKNDYKLMNNYFIKDTLISKKLKERRMFLAKHSIG